MPFQPNNHDEQKSRRSSQNRFSASTSTIAQQNSNTIDLDLPQNPTRSTTNQIKSIPKVRIVSNSAVVLDQDGFNHRQKSSLLSSGSLLTVLLFMLISGSSGKLDRLEIAVKIDDCETDPLERRTRRADELARSHGFTNEGQIGSLPCYYLFAQTLPSSFSSTHNHQHRHQHRKHNNFENTQPTNNNLHSAKTAKGNHYHHHSSDDSSSSSSVKTANHNRSLFHPPQARQQQQQQLSRSRRLAGERERFRRLRSLIDDPNVGWTESQRVLKRVKRDNLIVANDDDGDDGQFEIGRSVRNSLAAQIQLPWRDPMYQNQWYLIGKADAGWDMRVRECWERGLTGKNVTVSILDDGIQPDHPDLIKNYEPLASYDVNDNDNDPTPRDNGLNKHGTRCAGEVSSEAGNDWCGVGVAYDSKIGGIRLLDGRITDSVEAASLSHNPQFVDIYSASWGPDDDGRTFDGPGPLARQALHSGIIKGRDGKGSIFVWASGNGGARSDSCSYDGYTTSIYTLSISSANIRNRPPWYLEKCPATIATTYSSGAFHDAAVVTTDMPNTCTRSQTGTSASAPMAAGIVALGLEAKPSLTWRDVQHLVLRTADPTPLLGNHGWHWNGVGRQVSNTFGYGLMNADAFVREAESWENVPEQHLCTYTAGIHELNPVNLKDALSHNFTMIISGCSDTEFPVRYLEHVQIRLKVKLSRRGALKANLTSPMGTSSILLPGRAPDSRMRYADFYKWPLMSVQYWGEDPRGNWTLSLDVNDIHSLTNEGTLYGWSLLLYGTDKPAQPNDPQYDLLNPSGTDFVETTDEMTTGDNPHVTQGRNAVFKMNGQGTAPGRKLEFEDRPKSTRYPYRKYFNRPKPSSAPTNSWTLMSYLKNFGLLRWFTCTLLRLLVHY